MKSGTKMRKAKVAKSVEIPKGLVIGRLADDIAGLVNEVKTYRRAYERLTGAIDELASRSMYRRLLEDLKRVLEPGSNGVGKAKDYSDPVYDE